MIGTTYAIATEDFDLGVQPYQRPCDRRDLECAVDVSKPVGANLCDDVVPEIDMPQAFAKGRFGSIAALQSNNSLTSGFGGKAVIWRLLRCYASPAGAGSYRWNEEGSNSAIV